MSDPGYRFLPWVRSGAATAVTAPDAGGNLPSHADLPVQLRVTGGSVDVRLRLYGPGDVLALSPGQVVRSEPAPGTPDEEPNLFPSVELRRADLPWLFTPAGADAEGRLRPWLCLVVVRMQAGVRLRTGERRGVDALEIAPPAVPADELPDLSESWAWAWAQVADDVEGDLDAVLTGGGHRATARLVCPRRLDPEAHYLACVVPAFEAGRRAALGEPVDEDAPTRPAWSLDDPPERLVLPVFHHWEFRTGLRGDFESLVRLLEPRPLSPRVGLRTVDVSDPGAGLPRLDADDPGAVLDLAGALRSPGAVPREWPEDPRTALQAALAERLDAPARALADGSDADPVVGPPLYGRRPAGRDRLGQVPDDPSGWFAELNLDPRHRAVAAVGTAVVQRFQEPLMAAAWRQAGEVARANRVLQQGQLARWAGQGIRRKHLQGLEVDGLLRATGPVHGRIRLAGARAGSRDAGSADGGEGVDGAGSGGSTDADRAPSRVLRADVAASRVPPGVVSAPFRRAVRPRGPLARRAARLAGPRPAARGGGTLAVPLGPLDTGDERPLPPDRDPAGLVSVDEVSDQVGGEGPRFAELTARAVDEAPARPDLDPEGGRGGDGDEQEDERAEDGPAARRFRDAAGDHQAFTVAPPAPEPPAPEPLGLAEVREGLLRELDPEGSVAARVLARLRVPGAAGPPDAGTTDTGTTDTDPMAPVLAGPRFPQPMVDALREVRPDLLLPGLDEVPPNTVALAEGDAAFVAAFLVGLNAEMSRELLYREYPGDLRATAFRRFWDRRGEGDAAADIPPVHTWSRDGALGDEVRAQDETLVLLIRGELLRRYPDALLYAVRARWTDDLSRRVPDDDAGEREPEFRGTLEPDLTYLGFPGLSTEAARGDDEPGGDPGWFVVLQQQPTAPRFGLDVAVAFADDLEPLTRWADLSWGHLAADADALRALTHAPVGGSLPDAADDTDPPGLRWGQDAAHMAAVTLQRPVRVCIHAADLLPREQPDA